MWTDYSSLDNIDIRYELSFPDGKIQKMTERDLFDYYVLYDHKLKLEFADLILKLETETITAEDNTYDWSLQVMVYNGLISIKRIREDFRKNSIIPPVIGDKCIHISKYINRAGGIKFWVCPDCKADLGDA